MVAVNSEPLENHLRRWFNIVYAEGRHPTTAAEEIRDYHRVDRRAAGAVVCFRVVVVSRNSNDVFG
jgi:hypothetical protein